MKAGKLIIIWSCLIIGILACGRPSNLEATISAQNTEMAMLHQTQDSQADVPDSTEFEDSIAGEFPKETTPTTTLDGTGQQNVGTVGPWQIVLVDSGEIKDFAGKLPEEGHKFHRLKLQILNISNEPVFFTPGLSSLGYFLAKWEGYDYSSIAVQALQGYIPPGWPVSLQIIFDLPEIVESPQFVLNPPYIGQDKPEPMLLNFLDTKVTYEPPPILQIGDEFLVQDKISITPTNFQTFEYDDSHFMQVDAIVKNLFGHDIDVESEPIVLQLFLDGLIVQVHGTVFADLMPFINFYDPGYPLMSDFRTVWSPSEGTSTIIAPGITKDGSFPLNWWWPSKPEGGLLLMIMYDTTNSLGFSPNNWAIYQLNNSAHDLYQKPISPLNLPNIAIEKARLAASEENWVVSSVLFGYASRIHPGDQEVLEELKNVQQFAGHLVFQKGNELYIRRFGDQDQDSVVHFVVPQDTSYKLTKLSPDGRYFILIDTQSRERAIYLYEIETKIVKIIEIPDWVGSVRDFGVSYSGDEMVLEIDSGIIRVLISTGEFYEIDNCEGYGNTSLIGISPSKDQLAYLMSGKLYVSRVNGSD